MNGLIKKAFKLQVAGIMKYAKVEPKHGLTEGELKSYFGDLLMNKMGKWMDGQTCMVTKDRQVIIYPEDIDRFVGLLFEGRPTYWD